MAPGPGVSGIGALLHLAGEARVHLPRIRGTATPSFTLEPARSAGRMPCPRDAAAGLMLDRLVLRLVGRFPRAAGPVHIGFSIRVWIRLIPLRIRPVGIRTICHEHQRANDNDCQLCFHDDALCQAIQVVEGPGLARGGHRGRPGPGSMRGVKEHFQMSMIRAGPEIAFV
jgi:hypothetical protein